MVDGRRYNAPTSDEVAVILPGTGSEQVDKRDIILHERSGALQRMSEKHPAYDPLHFPILFPKGEQGWQYELRKLHRQVPVWL